MAAKKKAVDTDAPESSETATPAVAVPTDPAVKPKKGNDVQSQLGALLSSEIMVGTFKSYGKRVLIEGREVKAREIKKIPTGIFPLDFALEGGWGQGGIHTLFGHKSSFKTTALYSTIGQAQQMCANCWVHATKCVCKNYREPVIAFLDVEGALDARWASRFFDLDKILVSTPEYAEQSLSVGEALLRSKKCDIFILDSLAFLTPAKEIEEDISKDLMGVQARVLGKGVRKFTAALNAVMMEEGKRPTVFFTNQIRMKLGVMFGNPETTPGGLAPGFVAWTEVRMKGGKYKMDDNGERPLFADFGFSVEKNKTGTPRVAYDFRMALADSETTKLGQFDDSEFIVTHLERAGAISGGGSSWQCLGEKFGKKTDIGLRVLKDIPFRMRATDFLIQTVKPTPLLTPE